MRILLIGEDFGRGGMQRVLQNFALAYQQLGHEVAAFSYLGGGPRQQAIERAGIPVYVADGSRFEEALNAADEFGPDIIHIHRAGLQNDRETAILRRLRHGQRRVMETNVFARVDYSPGADLIDVHLQLSAWCMWRWRRWLGRQRSQRAGVIVPNAVDPDSFLPASPAEIDAFRQRHQIPADAYICGRVGQASSANWHPATLKAFSLLARQDPRAYLLLLGLPGSLAPALRMLPEEVRRRCIELPLTDSDHELSVVYSSMDCFLHAAASGESFGLVLTEAMLCGCPVVTVSRPHKSNTQVEVVGHLKGGIVAGSLRHLAEAALALRRDDQLRSRVRAGARAHVISRFEMRHVAATAVRIAELVLQHGDRRALIQRLEQEEGLQTETSDRHVKALLEDTMGGPCVSELLQMRLIHNPVIQRAIASYLGWRHQKAAAQNSRVCREQ